MKVKDIDGIIGGLIPLGILQFINQTIFIMRIWKLRIYKSDINWSFSSSIIKLIVFVLISLLLLRLIQLHKKFERLFYIGYWVLFTIILSTEIMLAIRGVLLY